MKTFSSQFKGDAALVCHDSMGFVECAVNDVNAADGHILIAIVAISGNTSHRAVRIYWQRGRRSTRANWVCADALIAWLETVFGCSAGFGMMVSCLFVRAIGDERASVKLEGLGR